MEPPEPNEMQQLEALAFQFAQKSHALEEELDQMRKAEGEHLNEILRLRDVVVQLEQARMPTPPSGAGTPGSLDNTAKLDQLQAENVSLVQERNRLLSQVMDVQEIQASLAAITLEKEHLDVQVNAMQQEKSAVEQELEAVKERYEAQIRGLEAAKSGGDSSTTEEHLAHIAQLKQVVANQDARYAKQLAELNVTAQRAEKAEEDLGQARLREGELTARLDNLQTSTANKDDAERKVFQLETMLGNMKSIEADYAAQVAVLQGEKQELVLQISEIQRGSQAAEASVRRCAELEEQLARESEARGFAEDRALQLEQAAAAAKPLDGGSATELSVLLKKQLEDSSKIKELSASVSALQGLLSREEEARRRAEEKALQLEQQAASAQTPAAAGGPPPSSPAELNSLLKRSVEDATTISQLKTAIAQLQAETSKPKASAVSSTNLGSTGANLRLQELESEVAAHVRRNNELNQVIQSVQDREARIAQLEQALSAPSSPGVQKPAAPARVQAGQPAAPSAPPRMPSSSMAAQVRAVSPMLNCRSVGSAAVVAGAVQSAAGDDVISISAKPSSVPQTPGQQTPTGLKSAGSFTGQPGPTSVDSVPSRAAPLLFGAPAAAAVRMASPVRLVTLPTTASEQARGASPMRTIAYRQLPSKQGGDVDRSLQAGVSPIRAVCTRDGASTVREVLHSRGREASPMPTRPCTGQVSGSTPVQTCAEPLVAGAASGKDPVTAGVPRVNGSAGSRGNLLSAGGELPPWMKEPLSEPGLAKAEGVRTIRKVVGANVH